MTDAPHEPTWQERRDRWAADVLDALDAAIEAMSDDELIDLAAQSEHLDAAALFDLRASVREARDLGIMP